MQLNKQGCLQFFMYVVYYFYCIPYTLFTRTKSIINFSKFCPKIINS